MNFHIEDEAVDDTTHVIELGGEVDLYTAPEFKERMVELIESGKKQIVVDLSKATFIDSTTLGVLVGGVKRLRPAGGSLALVCTDENITKIFEITGLDRVFPIHSSREEALDAAVSPGATSRDASRIAPPGPLAQLAEQETLNLKVVGSIPSRAHRVRNSARPLGYGRVGSPSERKSLTAPACEQ